MKLFLLVLSGAMILSSCKKDNSCDSAAPTTVASASETAYLQNYLNVNGITASSTHGMFYTINPGGGTSPNLCSSISALYTGTIIVGSSDGAVFNQTGSTPSSFTLNTLIPGWQLVLPMVKTGGGCTLYIPPSLAYGSQAVGTVPANSYLKFVITLVSVN